MNSITIHKNLSVINILIGRFFLIVILLLCTWTSTWADSTQKLPENKQTKIGLYLNPLEAFELVKQNANDVLFVDVRTRAEIAFLGMPNIVDANIPYMVSSDWRKWNDKKQTFGLNSNDDFVAAVERLIIKKNLDFNSPIIFICRSGKRSARAVNILVDIGYTKVYTVTEGFEGDIVEKGPKKGQRLANGWKNRDLPWSYKLDKLKMYL